MTYADWIGSAPTEADIAERIDLFILGAFGPAVAGEARTRTVNLSSETVTQARLLYEDAAAG